MTLRDIVVGLDGSDSSIDALRWATDLADSVSATVRILNTWHMPLMATVPTAVAALPSPAFMASQAGEQIDKACAAANVAGLAAQVAEGDAGAFLAAETDVADLVVIGRTGSGHRGPAQLVTELVLGSTARYCLHHARGPVATVPSDSTWIPNPTVVVGVDGSPASIAALRWAVDVFPTTASVHAVRAVPPYLEGLLALDRGAVDQIVEETRAELEHTVSTALAGRARDVTTTVVVENARHALTQSGFDPDVIVVGSRGRRKVITPFLGSTSDHVVRRANCPVVVIPPNKGTNE